MDKIYKRLDKNIIRDKILEERLERSDYNENNIFEFL
jgi:hypothetical protein